MGDISLPLIPSSLPPSVCFASEQDRLNSYASNLTAILPGGGTGGTNFVNTGPSTPDPSLNSFPWFVDGRIFTFSGAWISPSNLDTHERRLFEGSLLDLQTYDGGDTDPPSDRSGPMWVEDTGYQGRSPMGPGAIPASDPVKTLSVGENFGEGSHVLTKGELPNYALDTSQIFRPVTLDINEGQEFASGGAGARRQLSVTSGGNDEAHNNVPPVRGCRVIRWSGRLFYRKG